MKKWGAGRKRVDLWFVSHDPWDPRDLQLCLVAKGGNGKEK